MALHQKKSRAESRTGGTEKNENGHKKSRKGNLPALYRRTL